MPTPEFHEKRKLDRLIERLKAVLPNRLAVIVAWVVGPSGMYLRIPLGIILMIGGVFSILPFLGIWMLPLGLLLIAIDVPFVRRFVIRTWPKLEARWRLYRARRAARAGGDNRKTGA